MARQIIDVHTLGLNQSRLPELSQATATFGNSVDGLLRRHRLPQSLGLVVVGAEDWPALGGEDETKSRIGFYARQDPSSGVYHVQAQLPDPGLAGAINSAEARVMAGDPKEITITDGSVYRAISWQVPHGETMPIHPELPEMLSPELREPHIALNGLAVAINGLKGTIIIAGQPYRWMKS